MTNREKVIANVTGIVSDMQEEVDEWKDYSDSELSHGLTCDCDWWYKTLQTLKDALALLKEQEPQVLTAENFDTQHDLDWSRGLPAWVEYRRDGEWGEYWGDTQDEWAVVRKDMLNAEGYRCWTGYPSQKQRKETPWEREQPNGTNNMGSDK